MNEPGETEIAVAAMAIHDDVTLDGSTFGPTHLVRTVNRLRALGSEDALQALRSYVTGQALADLEAGHGPTEPERAMLAARVAFAPTDGHDRLPPLRLGNTGIEWESEEGRWPMLPLIVADDLPFLLVEFIHLGGVLTNPENELDLIDRFGRLPEEPMTPGDPSVAVKRLLRSDRWSRLRKSSRPAAERLVYLQALNAAAVLPAASEIRSLIWSASPDEVPSLWASSQSRLPWGDLYWDDQEQALLLR